ncbi:MAG: hypothetical protein HY716_00910 [Planctomycetes bacterium]|nr:hypothetical protein [Planctomycetota bacterium]
MRVAIGRALQLLGLATVLVGLGVGIAMSNVKAELLYLGAGVALFYGGRWLEKPNP